ncbi:MAG: phenylalanine--tRNA ligase subunit beta [Anaerolineae bacterium]
MKVPFSWLKEYVDCSQTVQQIAEALTLGGLEVEGVIHPIFSFRDVIVAKIMAIARHPNADKLTIATVFDGKETYQVVCGAPNCREGLKTAFAKIGALLKDPQGKEFKIKKAILRDVESFGMLCSEKDLGLSESHEGLIELPSNWKEGEDLTSLLADPILEISLTPNLGHCMSIRGVARELAALLPASLKELSPFAIDRALRESGQQREVKEDSQPSIDKMLKVEVEDALRCPRYACQMLKGLAVGPSPSWLKNRLESCGIRSINNIVDATNFIMLELGQPLHAFDYEKIIGKRLKIASCPSRISFTTLDNKQRELPENTLVICDAERPLAIAGIMGGENSMVTENTRDIVLEAAYFEGRGLRQTAKHLNLRTDSLLRFEKGIDPEDVVLALERAASLIQELCGGVVIKGVIDHNARSSEKLELFCRTEKANELLGTQLSQTEMVSFLRRLNIELVKEEDGRFQVAIPSYRHDIKLEVDLIEEIGRIYGYNYIPKKTAYYCSSPLTHAPLYLFEKKTRSFCIAQGLQECITCDLISPKLSELSAENALGTENFISVLNPSSIDHSVLRPTLLPGLLQVVKSNLFQQNHDLALFEVGRIHCRKQQEIIERSTLAIACLGASRPYHYDPKPREVDFFDLKGVLENFFIALGILNVHFKPSFLHTFHPGRQARIVRGEEILGVIGEVHPVHLKKLDIGTKVFFAELDLHDLFSLSRQDFRFQELSTYPGSDRDWTLTVKEGLAAVHLIEAAWEAKSQLLENVSLLDLYKSKQIGEDRKNITLRFYYRDRQKTISMEAVEKEHAKITQSVAQKLRDWLC